MTAAYSRMTKTAQAQNLRRRDIEEIRTRMERLAHLERLAHQVAFPPIGYMDELPTHSTNGIQTLTNQTEGDSE